MELVGSIQLEVQRVSSGLSESLGLSALLFSLLTPFSGRLLAYSHKMAAAGQPTDFQAQISRCRGWGSME